MTESYLRSRAEWFTSEAYLTSEINAGLHSFLDTYGTRVDDFTSIDDIPLSIYWTLSIVRKDSGGAAVPIVCGTNGAYDQATGQLLDIGDLERLANDLELIVGPFLFAAAPADPA